MKRIIVLFVAFVATHVAYAQSYVTPVATARVNNRTFTTTTALKNPGTTDVSCAAIYAIPNDPKGGTLRATYSIGPGKTTVEEDTLKEVGAIGTMRWVCTGEVFVAARIQTSTDDGKTFDAGRTFAGLREDAAISHGALTPISAEGDVVVAEVAGKPVTIEAIVHDSKGREFGRKTYEVPAFAQQIVNLSKAHTDHATAIVDLHIVSGDGAIVAADETRDPALLAMAVRMRPESRDALAEQTKRIATTSETQASAGNVISLLGVAAFKAAPFQEPMTGLIFMRDRWYDPHTGTFLSPDPEGYADSANLYTFCHGDPVNCTDPTGRLGDGGDLRADFREKENAERARRAAEWCRANPVDCRKRDVRGAGIVRMVGGVGQTTAGAGAFVSTGPLPEPVTKGLGGTAIVRGIDNTVTGAVEAWTGEPHDTMTGRAMYLALVRSGISPAQASKITGWTETGVDLVSSVGSGVVPSVNNASKLRPLGGIVNIGGTGEVANVSNLNPVLGGTGGRTIDIPNHVAGYGEQIADLFAPNSARQIISRRLTFNTVDWQRVARGSYTVLQAQGELELNIYVSGLTRAEEAEYQASLLREFTRAGFSSVHVEGSGPGTMLLGTK